MMKLNRKWKQVPQIVTQLSERGVNAEIINPGNHHHI